ncbi:MAG: lysophospholipid acyltransferase family protein [Planctomycetota bacterium]
MSGDGQPEQWEYRSAGDLDQGIADRLGSVRREPGLISWCTCNATRLLARLYLRIVHRLGVDGTEHLPEKPPAIVIANHCSHLDAAVLLAALPGGLRRDAFPVSADDYFFCTTRRSLAATLLIGALPIKRGKAVRHALGDLRKRLTGGATTLILFPEGTRSEDGTLGEFKPGLGMLTAGLDVPIIPARIIGTHAALPKGSRFAKPHRITVRFGEAMCFKDTPNKRDGWEQTTAECRAAIEALGNQP